MEGDNDAPITPATTANVVTAPLVAPYTKSSIDHFMINSMLLMFRLT
jgi:hypothetical protein